MCIRESNSAVHCLLALGQGSDDGVLIYSGGYDYPRLAAYLPGMRDILNARLERAADFIVHQGTEATENGSWSISCEELEKQTGITVRRGNGLDGMLLEALMRRSAVASVSMTDTGIDMAYHLNFCPRIPGQKPCYFTKLPEDVYKRQGMTRMLPPRSARRPGSASISRSSSIFFGPIRSSQTGILIPLS